MNMRNFLWLLILIPIIGVAQENEEKSAYQFTDENVIEITSVKDQNRSGTCWSFSGLGLIEAELLRETGKEYDLSEMYIVRKSYEEKAARYVRMHGLQNFSGGGGFGDIINVWKNYGLIPETSYEGMDYDTSKQGHNHYEMDAILSAVVKTIVKNPGKRITPAWKNAFTGILDAYLGEEPEKITDEGVEYTPEEYAEKALKKLNPDDYIMITSFNHHPFYEQFALEIQDNWKNDLMYNVTMEELCEIVNTAIENGYTVAWAADVSDEGFSWNNGLAVLPETELKKMNKTEREKWSSVTDKERLSQIYNFSEIVAERKITQEDRQIAFDNFSTTDDHGMLIFGTATDEKGNRYFKVKNSWGESGKYDGYMYCSETYLKFKTTDIMINKNALSKEMKKKLGIK